MILLIIIDPRENMSMIGVDKSCDTHWTTHGSETYDQDSVVHCLFAKYFVRLSGGFRAIVILKSQL